MSAARQTFELARARVLVFLREPEVVFWVFAFPLVLAAVLGFAFRESGVEPSKVALARGAAEDELARRLADARDLALERHDDEPAIRARLRRGALDAWIVPGAAGEPPRLVIDPDRPEAETTRLRLVVALSGGAHDEVLAIDPIEERGSRYVDFLFPGLIGLNLMGTGMWLLGFATADMRQRKLLKRMLVTPMRKTSFLAGLIGSRLAFLVAEVLVLTLFGRWVLGVPFEAGLGGFALLCVLAALSFAGLGMLATARVRTVQGASGLLNVVMMPMWLLSGVFFSYERFPAVLHPVLRLLPLSALNDALRATMLDGRSLLSLPLEVGVLAVWGGLAFVLALRFFRWQ